MVFIEILLIAVLLLMLFWSKKFFEIMKKLGGGVRAFNEGFKKLNSKNTSAKKTSTAKKAAPKKNIKK